MLNPTELMQSILTSEEAQIIIDHMSPIYGEARVFLWLLQAIGLGLDEAESCKDDFDLQSLIARATWSLKYYEEQYGLPTNTDLSDEERRNKVFAKMRSSGQMNPARMESLLSAQAGVPVRIEENTGQNTFSVISDITNNPASVDALVNKLKPAHLVYNFEIHPEYSDVATIYHGTYADVENEIVAVIKTVEIWTMSIPTDTIVSHGGMIQVKSATYNHTTHDWNYFAPTSATVDRCIVQDIPEEYLGLTWSASVSNDHKSLHVEYFNGTEEDITISERFSVQVMVEFHY